MGHIAVWSLEERKLASQMRNAHLQGVQGEQEDLIDEDPDLVMSGKTGGEDPDPVNFACRIRIPHVTTDI